jgi:hypothetical protein
MKYRRENVNGGKSVILKFTPEKGDGPVVTDTFIKETMKKEKLRKSNPSESKAYAMTLKGGKPKIPLVLFGNIERGPAESGSFPGHVVVDTKGDVKVVENWTRGISGEDWHAEKWEFLFAPA